jgi:hypothetical protein
VRIRVANGRPRKLILTVFKEKMSAERAILRPSSLV